MRATPQSLRATNKEAATRAASVFQLKVMAKLFAGLRKFAADAVEARLLLAAQ